MYKGSTAWGDTVSAIVHEVANAYLEEQPFNSENCRDIRRAAQMLILRWRPFKEGPTFVSHMMYTDDFITSGLTVAERRERASHIGNDMARRFPELLDRMSKNSDKWEELMTKRHNRVWRRAWRNTTALWRRLTTRISTMCKDGFGARSSTG